MNRERQQVSRREFLASSAALPLAAGVITIPGVARGAWAGGSDTIKVGVVGCGGRGTGAAAQAVRADPGCVLWSIGDVFQDRVESSYQSLTQEVFKDTPERVQVPAERRFTGFDAYKQVIDSGVDYVVLTSYPNFRPAHLAYAIERRKHVFAEKPVAVDAVGSRSILASAALAKAANLGLLVGFCWRYHDGMRAVFERVNAGEIGEITSVHTTYHGGTLPKRPRQAGWSDLEFQMRNWWHFTWISGDHIVEQAIHSVDRMAWALNDRVPKQVICLGGRAARSGPEHGDSYDHFAAIYEYDNGIRAHHTCRQIDNLPADNTDYIYGTKGRAVVNGFGGVFKLYDYKGNETWAFKGRSRDMYQAEHDEMLASIRAGTPINDAERSTRSNLMGIMGRMAAYSGRTVTWDHAMNSQENLQPATLEWGPMPTPEVAIPGKYKLI
ncbi:MAG: Gfo/Idh/MocA family oxidoreductase [Phycisphaeraceae bacterium]|nr:MAG: Gfo/Idh/MocA family oxidoreductase [Phycisphaeraceae bacterium]